MTLLFADSFDHYTTAQGSRKWTTFGHTIAATGRFGSGFVVAAGTAVYAAKTLPAASGDTVIIGMAFKSALFGGSFGFVNAAGVRQLSFFVTAAGRVRVDRGDGTVLLTSFAVMTTNVWSYIEIKAKIANAAGTIDIKIDGAPAGSLAGDTQNAATATWDEIGLGAAGGGGLASGDAILDDLVVCDGSGAVNNDFVGDCRVEALFPTGAGATTAWVPLAGTNWDAVNDNPADDDASYVSSAAPTAVDTYAAANLTPAAGTVRGVQYVLTARKDDAGSRTVRPVVRIGVTDYPGPADLAVPSSYGMLLQPQDLNPGTAAAWTVAEINAAEFGQKLTA